MKKEKKRDVEFNTKVEMEKNNYIKVNAVIKYKRIIR